MAKRDMPEYPDNSNSGKAEAMGVPIREDEPKDRETDAVIRKKSLGRKIGDSIMPKSDRRDVGEYIIFDVALPALKETISEMVVKGIDMILFGETRSRSGRSSSRNSNYHKSYGSDKYSASSRRAHGEDSSYRRRGISMDDILFSSRAKAERAYDKLLYCIDEYRYAKVADLFDEAGITPDWPADRYGWDDLPDRPVVDRVRFRNDDGEIEYRYSLNLPNPYRIND